jgi:hypothetical protein
MKMHKLLILLIACMGTTAAMAQWQWVDKDGRKIFSDRPPPADVPDKNILKHPGGNKSLATPSPAAPEADSRTEATSAPTKPVAAAKDTELEKRKAEAEAAEDAKKKAQADKLAKERADNCKRAQQSKAAFDTGRPITQMNDKGERIYLDEKDRNAETKRLQAIIASDCGPASK